MATFAFLGTPEDDRTLQTLYTEITVSDVYKRRSRLSLLTGANSLMDTTPLAGLTEKHVTMETMQRIAREHEKGRRLAIGTTNLDFAQIWYWRLGEIATLGTSDALELYRKLLLAAASPPVVFPPVEIDGHLLADGAVIDNLMIVGLFAPCNERTYTRSLAGKVYNIHNGRLTLARRKTG
jgi:predicted acylesterase/phospholipase RssA